MLLDECSKILEIQMNGKTNNGTIYSVSKMKTDQSKRVGTDEEEAIISFNSFKSRNVDKILRSPIQDAWTTKTLSVCI